MMACERYTESGYELTQSQSQSSWPWRLEGADFYTKATTNYAQYPFCKIYASEKNVVFITKSDDERIGNECLILFIMELLMLQLCAISSVYDEIIGDFEKDDFSKKIINRVNRSFSNAARLWDCDNFTYLAAKKIYEEIAQEFNIPRLRGDNKANLDMFEKIATVKSQEKTQTFMFWFTLAAGFSAISGLVMLVVQSFEGDTTSLSTLKWTALIIASVLAFYGLWSLQKPRNKAKKKKKSKNTTKPKNT